MRGEGRVKSVRIRNGERPRIADVEDDRVAERERISTVFTIDRADFLVYRPLGSRRFAVIP